MQNIRFGIFYLIFFLSLPVQAHFKQTELEKLAQRNGFGYKSANLVLLQKALASPDLQKQLGAYRVHVPDFVPLSSKTIQSLLQKTNLNLDAEWAHIISEKMVSKSYSVGQALTSKTFPKGFLEASQSLAQKIKASFVELSENSQISHEKLAQFLKTSEQKNWRLMVRSTGKEDTDKLANAGGNLSVANVSPQMKDVFVAIGQVIASYFEERSLTQRLSAGDETIFEMPLTPVLIQRMIGEQLGGAQNPTQIPVGCVLYTEEPSGRVKHMMTLQCAFGHNEGVVQSLVPLDTYYVDHLGNIQSIVKAKGKRLVPMFAEGVFGLSELENPQGLKKAPALSRDAVLAIAKVGQAIDNYYGKRMDLELVYEPFTKTIFIVQARPLVIPTGESGPSYVSQVTAFSTSQVLRASPISIKEGSVQRISEKQQVIVSDTLEQALQVYTSPTTNRNLVKTILVQKQADATSHAAATFRGDGKTIFVVEDKMKLQKWLKETEYLDIWIDGQRELIINAKETPYAAQKDAELFESRIWVNGWLNYPLPLRVSVNTHQPAYCLAPQLKPAFFFQDMYCLVDRLKDEVKNLDQEVAELRRKSTCIGDISSCSSEQWIAKEALQKLQNIQIHAHEVLKQTQKNPGENQSLLMRLFPKRFLESLVHQDPNDAIVNSYSLASVRKDYAARQRFLDEEIRPLLKSQIISGNLLKDPSLFGIAEKGFAVSLTEPVGRDWIVFVGTIAKAGDKKQKQALLQMVNAFAELEMFPLWVNSLFAQEFQSRYNKNRFDMWWDNLNIWQPTSWFVNNMTNEEVRLLDRLVNTYQQSSSYLKNLVAKKQKLVAYDVSVWEKSKLFSKNRTYFKQEFLDYFLADNFLKQDTDLQKLAAVTVSESFVETFDQTIKALKSSTDYKDTADKVGDFEIRIEDYFQVLDNWSRQVPDGLIIYHPEWPLEEYLENIHDKLLLKKSLYVEIPGKESEFFYYQWHYKQVPPEKELFPSLDFSVAAAALGSMTAFNRHYPGTLEDFFTLIHQSLNTVISAQLKNVLGKNLVVPASFQSISEALQKVQEQVFITGIWLNNENLTYSISLPLNNHSAKLLLTYHKANDSIDLRFQFLGEGRNRWYMIYEYGQASGYSLLDVKKNNQEIQYTVSSVNRLPAEEVANFTRKLVEIAY